MAKTLQQILGYRNLMGLINDPRGGIPADVLPPAFTSRANARRIVGDTGSYVKVEGTRKLAQQVMYGSPSKMRELKGVSLVPVKLLHAFEHIVHNMAVLEQLRSYTDESAQNMGQQEIDRQTREFRQLFNNLSLAAMYSLLTKGAIYVDGNGNMLPSSSGAAYTIDFGVPAGNQTSLDIEGSGAIIGASWATTSTDIIAHVQNIADALERKYGYRPAHAFYGKNVRGFIVNNDDVQAILDSDPVMAASFRQGGIPTGFAFEGLQWHRGTRMFFEDPSGTIQTLIGDDDVVFTPEPSPDWMEWIEGSYTIPTDVGGVSSDGSAAMGNLQRVSGMFSYAKIIDDPVGIKHYAGDTFLPVLKVPGAIAIAHTTP